MSEFKLPTEVVELPSKGLVYPESNPLSSGKVEMKYMTAKEEDILTNQAYIKDGTVLDKLLKSLIISKINYNDLVVGDKNAILIASRILGYGSEYSFMYNGVEHTVNLATLENKPFDESSVEKGVNNFTYTLPHSGLTITFKLLTHGDEGKVTRELQGYKKIDKNASPELTTRLKHMITSIDGNSEDKVIRDYIDNHLLARDSRALREHIKQVQPDVDLTYTLDTGETVEVPINLSFFWPDA